MSSELILIGDKILIEEIKPEATTGGFDAMGEQEVKRAKVVSIGNGRLCDNGTRATMTVKVGDVLLLPNMGLSFDVNGQRMNIVKEEDIIAIIR